VHLETARFAWTRVSCRAAERTANVTAQLPPQQVLEVRLVINHWASSPAPSKFLVESSTPTSRTPPPGVFELLTGLHEARDFMRELVGSGQILSLPWHEEATRTTATCFFPDVEVLALQVRRKDVSTAEG
jgi:hypothetical protein